MRYGFIDIVVYGYTGIFYTDIVRHDEADILHPMYYLKQIL